MQSNVQTQVNSMRGHPEGTCGSIGKLEELGCDQSTERRRMERWGQKGRKAGIDGFPRVHLGATLDLILEPRKNHQMVSNSGVTGLVHRNPVL